MSKVDGLLKSLETISESVFPEIESSRDVQNIVQEKKIFFLKKD